MKNRNKNIKKNRKKQKALIQNDDNEDDIEVHKYVRVCNRYNMYIYYTYMCLYICLYAYVQQKIRN